MIEDLENVAEDTGIAVSTDMTKIEHFEGIGELVVGVGGVSNIVVTALCVLNDPQVNNFLLAQKLKLTDRITKTKVFPREGMALPNGEVYHEPVEEKEE